MVTITEARQQLSQARQQTESARKQVEQQRAIAQDRQRQLEEQRKKLPVRKSQKALRQTLEGVKGRTKRREIAQKEQAIGTEKGRVTAYQKVIQQFEEEKLKPTEVQIGKAETKLKQAELYQSAVAEAKKHLQKGTAGAYLYYVDTKNDPKAAIVKDILGKAMPDYQKGGRVSDLTDPYQRAMFAVKGAGETGLTEKEYKDLLKEVNYGREKMDISITEIKPELIDLSGQRSLAVDQMSYFKPQETIITKSLEKAGIERYDPSKRVKVPTIYKDTKTIMELSQLKRNLELEKKELLTGEISEKDLVRVRKIDEKISKIPKEVSFGFGFTGYEKRVPIEDVGTSFGIVRSQIGTVISGVGEEVSKLGKEEGYLKISGGERTIYEPQFGTQQYDLLSGEKRTGYKDIIVSDIKLGTKEQFRTVGEVGTAITLFALPQVGVPLASSSVLGVLGKYDYKPKEFMKEAPISEKIEVGADVLYIGTLGVSKAVKTIKGRSEKKAIEEAISKLSKKQISSLKYIDEGNGYVTAKGFRTVDGIKEEISIYGRLAETEKGFKFIPSGEGLKVITGEVTPSIIGLKLKPRRFISGTQFELGTKGTGVRLGELGKIQVFEEIGVTTIIPKRETFEIVKRGTRKVDINFLDLPETTVSKDLTLPIDQRNIFLQYDKRLGLSLSPQEKSLIITKPKELLDETITSFIGGDKPSSKEFFTKLYSSSDEIVVSKVKDIKTNLFPELSDITKKVTTPTTTITKELPSMVGGLGLKTLPYSGQGIYEVTEVTTIAPKIDLGYRQNLIIEDKIKEQIVEKEFIGTKEILQLGLKQKVKEKQIYLGKIKEVSLIKQPIRIKEEVKYGQMFRQELSQKQVLKQLAKQIVKQQPIQKTKVTPKSIIKIIPGVSKEPAKDLIKGITKEQFTIFARKDRIDIEVGKATTKKEAEELLVKELRGTLSAGGFVTLRGRKVKLDTGRLGQEFRASKRDPLTLIQKKQRRLAARPETKEIQLFRKGNKRSKWSL